MWLLLIDLLLLFKKCNACVCTSQRRDISQIRPLILNYPWREQGVHAEKETAHLPWYTMLKIHLRWQRKHLLQCKDSDRKTGVSSSLSLSLLYVYALWTMVQICSCIWQLKVSTGSCEMLVIQHTWKNLSPCHFQNLFSKTFVTEGGSQVLPSFVSIHLKVPLPLLKN